VFFSYTGGLVFPSTPAIDCDERLKGKSVKEAIAMYDKAIADNPRDTRALVNRAVLRIRSDPHTALDDLDAAIRLEPGNAVALSLRASVRNMIGDYDGAMADSDAAIANGMHNAQAYVFRAFVRRAQGDNERAIREFDEALRLDPRHEGALGGRARCLFAVGRYEAAEGDLAALLAMRPDAFDSLWLSFARVRRGLDGRVALEQGLANTKGEWPEPVLLYLLGRLDRDALLAAARADEKKVKDRECEARFYVAERLVTEGRRDEARGLLELARDQCPQSFIEYEGAISELAKLR
jgi:lipoprotein NlpI